MSRRRFLGVTGAGVAAAATAPAWLPRVTFAKDHRGAQREVIVVVFLRGGADGLSMCIPYQEQAYYAARPNLSVPRPDSNSPNRAFDLDGVFGLNPSLAPLMPLFRDGRLLIVHAAGSPDTSRSHFEAMRLMEVARPETVTNNGWLTRHQAEVAPVNPGSTLRAIGLNDSVPRSLLGETHALAIPTPGSFSLAGDPVTQALRLNAIQSSYFQCSDPPKRYALNTLHTMNVLSELDVDSYEPEGGAVYPSNQNGLALRSAAALIKAQVGAEVIAMDIAVRTWDTHQLGGTPMATEMRNMADCLAAFAADMFVDDAPPFTLVVMSEFGRSLIENASYGTDHGRGGVMWVMGSAVAGGRVTTIWPGLAYEQLYDHRDLQVTIDYRDILAEILQTKLGNDRLDLVFPGFTPTFRGVYAP
ncbi:MAG: DUF1501 domain-containing protein [Pyrinomonadaceae bacterium]|nr:DUF1501 domain-containing protein [Phycisphaerales bacterium]